MPEPESVRGPGLDHFFVCECNACANMRAVAMAAWSLRNCGESACAPKQPSHGKCRALLAGVMPIWCPQSVGSARLVCCKLHACITLSCLLHTGIRRAQETARCHHVTATQHKTRCRHQRPRHRTIASHCSQHCARHCGCKQQVAELKKILQENVKLQFYCVAVETHCNCCKERIERIERH